LRQVYRYGKEIWEEESSFNFKEKLTIKTNSWPWMALFEIIPFWNQILQKVNIAIDNCDIHHYNISSFCLFWVVMVATVSHTCRFLLMNLIESHIINFFETCTLPIGIKLESVWKIFCKDTSLLADWIKHVICIGNC
jgi:hypothetical protein